MKIQLKLATAMVAMLTISNAAFPVCAADTGGLPEATISAGNNVLIPDSSLPEEWTTVSSGDPFPSSGSTLKQDQSAAETGGSDVVAPEEAPTFSASVKYSFQGYLVKGTFTEFLPDTSLIQPLYSLDGETWQPCQTTWNVPEQESETTEIPKTLQNQICLYSTQEPLSGYLAGQLDRFYLKLQITLENGIAYETQTAVIDRGSPRPLPEEFRPAAGFVPAMYIVQTEPYKYYGQYQITVSVNATPEDISALLPDTLPIDIQLFEGKNIVTNGVVDCPVTWKPLSLPCLTAGESVIIEDAAEEIIVPAGTRLDTPHGTFTLNEPLGFDQAMGTDDEIRLILNVVEENAVPTGALDEIDGLQMTFHLKPTGATAIRAYTLSEGESEWVELPAPLLPEKVNSPSSAANSAYTTVLENTSEPYQSYLTAWNAGAEPAPFLVGLKIEGGVYDGRQLILAWPDTYELPARLPDLNGSGGNECNAGSGNQNSSTSEGQRPNLPQNPEYKPDVQEPETPQNPEYKPDIQEPEPPQNLKGEQDAQEPEPPQNLKGEQDAQEPEPPQDPENAQDSQESELPQEPEVEQNTQQPEPLQPLKDETDGRTTGQENSFMQISIPETVPVLTAGTGYLTSVPAADAETGSPVQENTGYSAEHSLHRLLLPSATAVTVGVCIAAIGKVTAGSIYGRISEKIIHMIHRILHLKLK